MNKYEKLAEQEANALRDESVWAQVCFSKSSKFLDLPVVEQENYKVKVREKK